LSLPKRSSPDATLPDGARIQGGASPAPDFWKNTIIIEGKFGYDLLVRIAERSAAVAVSINGNVDSSRIETYDGFLDNCNGSINFDGCGNTLIIRKPSRLQGVYITLSAGGSIIVDRDVHASGLILHARGAGARVEVGHGVAVNGDLDANAAEPSTISIGADCLFGSNCRINSSDIHHILDADTGERLNPARDVHIGEHVWLGGGVSVMKGAVIGRDSVVAAGAIVTGQFGPGCVLAGNPARVVREGVTWRA
jgi:acetyltransferase-like isoleucine patch superfamily enzyme